MARKVLLYPYVTEKTMNYMTGTPTQDFKDATRSSSSWTASPPRRR